MAKINGNDFVITAATSDGGMQEMFLHSNTASLEYTKTVIETTTKDSNSIATYIPGRNSYTMSVDGLLDYAGGDTANTRDTAEVFDLIQQVDTILFWAMTGDSTSGTGKITYSGQAILTSHSQSGGSDETAAWSASLQGSGAITKTVAT